MARLMDTKLEDFKLRFATVDDTGLILSFIRELAIYEELLDEVVAKEETLKESLFEKKMAEVIIGEYKGQPASFGLFFHNFSTFQGKPGLYLEDLYVKPEVRGLGIGKNMLSFLANLAIERDCGRFEWICLDWNEPAIEFYKSLGAISMDGWTVYRVEGESLDNLGKEF